jgi:hypothetical protein
MISIKRIKEIEEEAERYSTIFSTLEVGKKELFRCKYAKLIVKEIAKELRATEAEADRAFKAGETSERNVFTGNDYADMLEETFEIN